MRIRDIRLDDYNNIDKLMQQVHDLCVYERFRGRGIGKLLFSHVTNIAKEKGAERLDLMVWSFNNNALNFYNEIGMKAQRYILEKEL
ncbi:GNAT family N-acetyltransferase [Clostridium chauvoei]|uniref:GNAT family N-acetyltransferase n=1 Tax=Clostridium chauvoei TaxID=46867 RepID=UPI001C857195|nr:GNAT family N-acetyltransferase [Clostridium chauvoei]MBX7410192.1 GNAT family N-acetyltransferase [Clostridium chauvoei]